jgi:hypothetical protein
MERIDTTLDPTSRADLLHRNRSRCCICRNPAKAVGFYAISRDQTTPTLENLVVLCVDCYILALSSARELGENNVKGELIEYKHTWERLCQIWGDESTRTTCRITVEQGANTQQYHSDEAYIGSYYLDDGGEMVVEIKSDELVNLQITKGDSERSRVRYADAYEFNISFTAQRADYYSLTIESKSDDPVTIDLAISTFLDVARKQEAALEVINENLSQAKLDRASTPPKESTRDVERVPWRILPPGQHPFSDIVKYCESLQRQKIGVRYEIERLHRIFGLKPTKTYRGTDEFDGYFVFFFEDHEVAILDCPKVGNAIYVLKGDWRRFSRLTKSELLSAHQPNVTRVVHSGDWFLRLQQLIRM